MKLYSDDLVTVWLLTELRLTPLELFPFQNMTMRMHGVITSIDGMKRGARMLVNHFGKNNASEAHV